MKAAIKDRLNALIAFLRQQLTEASTVRGIVVLAGGLGALGGLDPNIVLPAALLLSGALAILLPDKLQ